MRFLVSVAFSSQHVSQMSLYNLNYTTALKELYRIIYYTSIYY